MTNTRCLTEGVDVPAIDCVVFADPWPASAWRSGAIDAALSRSIWRSAGNSSPNGVLGRRVGVGIFLEKPLFQRIGMHLTSLIQRPGCGRSSSIIGRSCSAGAASLSK
jgi:hypothetical protein